MEKRLKPRYYKNLKYQKNKSIKKTKKVRNNKIDKKSKKMQEGGWGFNRNRKTCISCIKGGECTKKMKHRRFGKIKLSSKNCKKYHELWKEMSGLGLKLHASSTEDFVKAIKLYKKKRPTKTLKGFIQNGIINYYDRPTPTKAIYNYILIKDKYKKRKVSLRIAKLLGY